MANHMIKHESVYNYSSYKVYLRDMLNVLGHGSRLKLAHALKCHSAYVSLVMNKDANLSLEQAEDVVEFLELTPPEGDFFILLVQLERAGTSKLRQRWMKRIQELRNEQSQLSKRVSGANVLDEATQARYYSRWHYAAVHMAVTIPALQTRRVLRQYLGLANEQLDEALEFLEKAALIRKDGNIFVTGNARVFLKSDSPFINRHHANLRECVNQFLGCEDRSALHYSTFFSLSRSDYQRIRERLLEVIEEVRSVVRPSPEEELAVLTLDWFVPRTSGEQS